MKKLDLGTRRTRNAHKQGWHTLDANPKSGATFIAAIPPLPDEVTEQRWDMIQAIHMIEHIYEWEAKQLIIDIWGCLNKGGVMVLETADFEFMCKVVAGVIDVTNHRQPEFLGKTGIWGSPEPGDLWQAHRFGYSPQDLKQVAVDCGFEEQNVKILPAQGHRPIRDFRIEATK